MASGGTARAPTLNVTLENERIAPVSLNSRPKAGSKAKFGHTSVVDLQVNDTRDLPYGIPSSTYLEEALVSMRGAPSPGAEASASSSSQAGKRWLLVASVLRSKHAPAVLELLFWISVVTLFGKGSEEVLADMRRQLCEIWHQLILEVTMKIDSTKRDTVLDMVHGALVQSIYRLMVDGFASEDRPIMVDRHADVVEKLNDVVNHEILGFRLNPRTCNKIRRQLLTDAVLQQPFMNRLKMAESQLRREQLEKKGGSGNTGARNALSFGSDNRSPMDEQQLEDVLVARQNSSRNKYMGKNIVDPRLNRISADDVDLDELVRFASSQRYKQVTDQLSSISVDRHLGHVRTGQVLLQKQLARLRAGEDPEEDEDDMQECDTPPELANAETAQTPAHPEVKKRAAIFRKQTAADLKLEAANREKFVRQCVSTESVEHDPKPGFNTAWCSPIIDRLAPSDRPKWILCKRVTDARGVSMSLPQEKHLPPLVRSASVPSPSGSTSRLKERRYSKDSPMGLGTRAEKDSIYAARSPQNVIVNMEPPKRIPGEKVTARLDSHLEGFFKKSFSNYTKEFDAYSGAKRQGMDPQRLRNSETAYVREMHSLLGGSRGAPLKLPAFLLNSNSGGADGSRGRGGYS